jgi:hypothetical protein
MPTHYILIEVYNNTKFDKSDNPKIVCAKMYMPDGKKKSQPADDMESGVLTALYRKYDQDCEDLYQREYGRGGKYWYEMYMDELSGKFREDVLAEVRKGFAIPDGDHIWLDNSFENGEFFACVAD